MSKFVVVKVRKPQETMTEEPNPEFSQSLFSPGATEVFREEIRLIILDLVQRISRHPEDVSVTYFKGEHRTVFDIKTTQRCLGQLIGAKGTTVTGLRALVKAMAGIKGIRAVVEISHF